MTIHSLDGSNRIGWAPSVGRSAIRVTSWAARPADSRATYRPDCPKWSSVTAAFLSADCWSFAGAVETTCDNTCRAVLVTTVAAALLASSVVLVICWRKR